MQVHRDTEIYSSIKGIDSATMQAEGESHLPPPPPTIARIAPAYRRVLTVAVALPAFRCQVTTVTAPPFGARTSHSTSSSP